MAKALLVDTERDLREMCDEVQDALSQSPMHRCIIEHAFGMMQGDDLEKTVLECKAEKCPNKTRRSYLRALKSLYDGGIIDKYMTTRNDEWHYQDSPFVQTVVTHLKKIYAERRGHL